MSDDDWDAMDSGMGAGAGRGIRRHQPPPSADNTTEENNFGRESSPPIPKPGISKQSTSTRWGDRVYSNSKQDDSEWKHIESKSEGMGRGRSQESSSISNQRPGVSGCGFSEEAVTIRQQIIECKPALKKLLELVIEEPSLDKIFGKRYNYSIASDVEEAIRGLLDIIEAADPSMSAGVLKENLDLCLEMVRANPEADALRNHSASSSDSNNKPPIPTQADDEFSFVPTFTKNEEGTSSIVDNVPPLQPPPIPPFIHLLPNIQIQDKGDKRNYYVLPATQQADKVITIPLQDPRVQRQLGRCNSAPNPQQNQYNKSDGPVFDYNHTISPSPSPSYQSPVFDYNHTNSSPSPSPLYQPPSSSFSSTQPFPIPNNPTLAAPDTPHKQPQQRSLPPGMTIKPKPEQSQVPISNPRPPANRNQSSRDNVFKNLSQQEQIERIKEAQISNFSGNRGRGRGRGEGFGRGLNRKQNHYEPRYAGFGERSKASTPLTHAAPTNTLNTFKPNRLNPKTHGHNNDSERPASTPVRIGAPPAASHPSLPHNREEIIKRVQGKIPPPKDKKQSTRDTILKKMDVRPQPVVKPNSSTGTRDREPPGSSPVYTRSSIQVQVTSEQPRNRERSPIKEWDGNRRHSNDKTESHEEGTKRKRGRPKKNFSNARSKSENNQIQAQKQKNDDSSSDWDEPPQPPPQRQRNNPVSPKPKVRGRPPKKQSCRRDVDESSSSDFDFDKDPYPARNLRLRRSSNVSSTSNKTTKDESQPGGPSSSSQQVTNKRKTNSGKEETTLDVSSKKGRKDPDSTTPTNNIGLEELIVNQGLGVLKFEQENGLSVSTTEKLSSAVDDDDGMTEEIETIQLDLDKTTSCTENEEAERIKDAEEKNCEKREVEKEDQEVTEAEAEHVQEVTEAEAEHVQQVDNESKTVKSEPIDSSTNQQAPPSPLNSSSGTIDLEDHRPFTGSIRLDPAEEVEVFVESELWRDEIVSAVQGEVDLSRGSTSVVEESPSHADIEKWKRIDDWISSISRVSVKEIWYPRWSDPNHCPCPTDGPRGYFDDTDIVVGESTEKNDTPKVEPKDEKESEASATSQQNPIKHDLPPIIDIIKEEKDDDSSSLDDDSSDEGEETYVSIEDYQRLIPVNNENENVDDEVEVIIISDDSD